MQFCCRNDNFCNMDNKLKLEKLLRNRGKSITKPREAVFGALQASKEPLSVTDLVSSLENVDKASVYRTVELFESVGIINRVWTGFKSKIELSEEFSVHHHHFTCRKCGRMSSFESEELEKSLEELENKNDFKLTHHSVELSGYCSVCNV